MKFHTAALDVAQSATRKAPSGDTRQHTKRSAKRRDADKARNTLMQAAQNESAGRRAKLAVRAKQTSNGTCAKYRMLRRIKTARAI